MPHIDDSTTSSMRIADLDEVTAFFVDLGLELEDHTAVEGGFMSVVTRIPDSRSEMR